MLSLKQSAFKYWIKPYCYNDAFIRHVKHKIKYDLISNLILLLCLPYLLLNYGFSLWYEKKFGFKKVERLMNEDRKKQFMYELAIVSISKNEGPYLIEWIEFHRLVGVEKFYFYDNESQDNTKEILKPYTENGIVEYRLVKGIGKQLDAYNDAIHLHKDECRWMAFIDMDEYLMPSVPFKPIYKIVDEIVYAAGKGAAGVGVNWAIYGTSCLTKRPDGLITENYKLRAENEYYLNFHIKCIANPRLITTYISPHYPIYIRGAYTVKEAYGTRIIGWGANHIIYKNLRINHYYTKSEEEYEAKRARGLGDRAGNYDDAHFEKYNKNDVLDFNMEPYIGILKSRVNSYPRIVI